MASLVITLCSWKGQAGRWDTFSSARVGQSSCRACQSPVAALRSAYCRDTSSRMLAFQASQRAQIHPAAVARAEAELQAGQAAGPGQTGRQYHGHEALPVHAQPLQQGQGQQGPAHSSLPPLDARSWGQPQPLLNVADGKQTRCATRLTSHRRQHTCRLGR